METGTPMLRSILILALLGACTAPPPVQTAPVAEPLPHQWHTIGESVEGRPIQVATFGTGSRRVYVIGGIHGDERPGLENVDRLRELLRVDGFLGDTTVRLLRDVNPDGSEHRTRTNANGVDLNRNFPAQNFRPSDGRGPTPLCEPETQALAADLEAFDPDIVIVFHAARRGPFVNFNGPGRLLAERFARAAYDAVGDWRVVPDMGYATPGSLGSWLGDDRGLPVLTIEFGRDQDPDVVWPGLEHALVKTLGPGAEDHLAR
tara:strand:- start:37 stop:819 length:783 start_codon:yes stop_codon:yes gene_type:complete